MWKNNKLALFVKEFAEDQNDQNIIVRRRFHPRSIPVRFPEARTKQEPTRKASKRECLKPNQSRNTHETTLEVRIDRPTHSLGADAGAGLGTTPVRNSRSLKCTNTKTRREMVAVKSVLPSCEALSRVNCGGGNVLGKTLYRKHQTYNCLLCIEESIHRRGLMARSKETMTAASERKMMCRKQHNPGSARFN
jgi:hypothetical protein